MKEEYSKYLPESVRKVLENAIVLKPAKMTTPVKYLDAATDAFFELYEAGKIAGDILRKNVSVHTVTAEISDQYKIYLKNGVEIPKPERMAQIVYERAFKMVSEASLDKMTNFLHENYSLYNYDEVQLKIEEYTLTETNIRDGVTKEKLFIANKKLANLLNAWNEFNAWLNEDYANYLSVAVIGNYFMGVENLFNKTNS